MAYEGDGIMKAKEYLDRLLNEATESVKSILSDLDDYRKRIYEHLRDISGSKDGYNFDIKIQKVNIPDSVRGKLSEDEIEGIYNDNASFRIEELIDELKNKYRWIGDAGTAGRSSGWLVISDKDGTYSDLENESYDDEKDAIKEGKKKLRDVIEISEMVEEAVKSFKADMQSEEFWKNYTDSKKAVMGEAKKETVPAFSVGDSVKLRKDVLQRHSRSVPNYMGYTREQFAWRKTLDALEGKVGKVQRVFPDSKNVNVDFDGQLIGINSTELEKA